MSELTRRDFGAALAAFAALGTALAEAQAPTAPSSHADAKLTNSAVFPFDQLPVHPNDNGGATRPVLSGYLATGEFVEVHETALPPGQMPHPPHHHAHSEFLLIREGQIEYLSDAPSRIVGPGAILFNASNLRHGMKNVGTTTANYFVVAIGVQSPSIPG